MHAFSNKWVRLGTLAGLCLTMIIVFFCILAWGVKTNDGVQFFPCAVMIMILIPILYFDICILNRLSWKLSKLFRGLLFFACVILFLVAYFWVFYLVFNPELHFIKADPAVAYLNGFFLGMLTVLAILYFLFDREKEKDDEDLTFGSLIGYWITIAITPVLTGFIGLMIHGIGQNWVGILLSILLMVLPVLLIVRSIIKDGLPLGNHKEWFGSGSSSSSYSSGSSSYSSGDSDGGDASQRYDESDIRDVLSRHRGCGWVWARDVYVSEVGTNDFSIELGLCISGYRAIDEHMAEQIPYDEENLLRDMADALDKLGVGYRFSTTRYYD